MVVCTFRRRFEVGASPSASRVFLLPRHAEAGLDDRFRSFFGFFASFASFSSFVFSISASRSSMYSSPFVISSWRLGVLCQHRPLRGRERSSQLAASSGKLPYATCIIMAMMCTAASPLA